MEFQRPRVAAIGLNPAQFDTIEPLCGTLHGAASWAAYAKRFSPFETDIAVMSEPQVLTIPREINVLVLAPQSLRTTWFHPRAAGVSGEIVLRSKDNTEHQLRVPEDCPDIYEELASDLAKRLWRDSEAPRTISATNDWEAAPEHLIETTTKRPVALRYQRTNMGQGKGLPIVTLALPHVDNLAEWFRAFLHDVHKIAPSRVPTPPPRLSQPSDWYTPEQNRVAREMSDIDVEIERLHQDRRRLEHEMRAVAERAEAGILRALWSDGDDLVAAVEEILSGIGFRVRNMDKEKSPGERNLEDLRLTVPDDDKWEAIAEVKGYTNDTKTSDARQLREYRDLYRDESGRFPDMTLWITNPHRRRDPSSRPSPNVAVGDAARIAEAVHIQTVDLFRIWRDVTERRMTSEDAIRLIRSAQPGAWTIPTPHAEQQPPNNPTA
ncbi:hypothetical protein [Candidatus Poriferisodalis sp.]|uniref:hypothetical protein n=1 Tax=Candidatus Poriferisodalis sp. TaxID=3101277 RepID=UPI003B5B6613